MPPKIPAPLPQAFNAAAHFIDRPAQEHPARVAIVGEPAAVTYAELSLLVNRVGNALRGSKCQPGERVLIVLPDSAEFIASFFGATKIGAVAVPVNPMTRSADYAYFLADSGARMAIVHSAALAEFLPAVHGTPLERVVLVGTSPSAPPEASAPVEFLNWIPWTQAGSIELPPYRTAASDTAFFLYTSGSGGQPKAAVHQHKDMLITSRGFAAGVLGLRPDDRTLSVSKLFFAYGLGNGMYFPFSVGASTVLNPDRPRADRIIDLVARHKPTVFFAVPTFYAALLREVDSGAAADFASVRLAVSAGEMLPPKIFEQFRKKFGLEILDGIGSTESLHIFISNRPDEVRHGTSGRPVAGYDVAIHDDQGAAVTTDSIGDLWCRGPSIAQGYWNNPDATQRTFIDGWLRTGDKYSRDAAGYYHYAGRADDMLKVGGAWVSPHEVESTLIAHPAVLEAAVVAHPDAEGLVKPKAFVVLKDAATASPDLAATLIQFVKARIAPYKYPHWIEFRAELPKTATGKIRRNILRDKG